MTTRKKPSRDKRAKKQPIPKDGQAIAERSARLGVPEEELQGPPARETTLMHDDRERAVQALIKVAQPSGRIFGRKPAAVRVAAVEALRLAATPAAVGTLEGLAADGDKEVRAAVRTALAELEQKPRS